MLEQSVEHKKEEMKSSSKNVKNVLAKFEC